MTMTNAIFAKTGALAVVLTASACSCLKSPELNMPAENVSYKYEPTAEYTMPKVEKPMVTMPTVTAPAPKVVMPAVESREYTYEAAPMAETMSYEATEMPVENVYFGYDSSALSMTAQEKLRNWASYINANGLTNVRVEGHCDERGTREYNLALGDRRAVAIKRFLAAQGVDESIMTTVSYGKERPAVQGHNESAWAMNRRGVIVAE